MLLFLVVLIFILAGFPVAFTLGGIAIIFGLIIHGADIFYILPLRIYGSMNNFILIAVPLFVFMGLMLEKSGIAERLLNTMAYLFAGLRGGLGIAVIAVGALLAASTGIVGATVVTMGLLALPPMLKRGYSPALATGTIASSGTLGQIIPPSIVLVLLGSVLQVSVGDLFVAAVVPSIILVVAYMAYVFFKAWIDPKSAPPLSREERKNFANGKNILKEIIVSMLLPLALILAVLGSIFGGIASPTEAAALGAMGAILLTISQKKLSLPILKKVMRDTTQLTSMVFIILVGATAFGFVFRDLGGDDYIISLVEGSNLSPRGFLLLVMAIVFVAGFFIDFIEITFIIVPIVTPIFQALGLDLVWVGILLAINLQTSFLTPPFGFALFYLKGVAPPEVKTSHLYRGIMPFVIIQLTLLTLLLFYPDILYVFR